MPHLTARLIVTGLIVAFFAFGGVVNLIGPKRVIEDFVRWGYPTGFHLVTGGLELAAAILVVIPGAHMLGLMIAFVTMLAAAVTLLVHREYAHMLPALAIIGLLALVSWV